MTTFRASRGVRHICVATIALIMAVAIEVQAQPSSGTQWRRGTTLGAFAGATSAGSAGGAVGTSLGWEVIPHLTLEGRGVWLDKERGSSDFVAWLGALVPVRPAGAVVPFASAGIGMYRATVEAGAIDVPEFYRRRLNTGERATFEDVALALGGGANVFVTSHLAIRPEVNVLVVTTRSETRRVPLYGVHVAYHFEPHKTR